MKINIKNKNVFDKILKTFKNEKNTLINKSKDEALDFAREIVPVKTGRLRDSLKAEHSENSITVTSDCPYAHSVEYGDNNRRPSGFMMKTMLFIKNKITKGF